MGQVPEFLTPTPILEFSFFLGKRYPKMQKKDQEEFPFTVDTKGFRGKLTKSSRAPCHRNTSKPILTDFLSAVVYPGFSEAGHVHTVVGASMFSKDSTFEGLQNSKCTR